MGESTPDPPPDLRPEDRATDEAKFLDYCSLLDELNWLLGHRRKTLEDADANHRTKVVKEIAVLDGAAKSLHAQSRHVKSKRDEELARRNRETDRDLIRTKTYLDELGHSAIGGLHHRINRSKSITPLSFDRWWKTLRVGTIDTWWDYRQLTWAW